MREYQTCIKNRIVSAINRYGLRDLEDDGDLFRGQGRVRLSYYKGRLPPHTQEGVIREWGLVDEWEKQILDLEEHLKSELKLDPAARRLQSLPGIGNV